MIDYTNMLRAFHEAFGHYMQNRPGPHIPPETVFLRKRLVAEECGELFEAMNAHDIVEIADALADLLYVTFGTAVAYGIPIDEVFDAVHQSNMAKLGGGKDADGKSLKPPGWRPPTEDIERILAAHRRVG